MDLQSRRREEEVIDLKSVLGKQQDKLSLPEEVGREEQQGDDSRSEKQKDDLDFCYDDADYLKQLVEKES